MNEPKLAVPVDAKRLVRDFLDAFDSLKTKGAPPTCSSPAAEEQRPAQLQEGCEQTFELVGGNVFSTMSSESPVPGTFLEASTGPGSGIDEQEPEQISAFQGAWNPEFSDYQVEASKTEHEIIEEFCADREMLERLQVTPGELRALSHVSMLGSLTCKQDLLSILREIRAARKLADPQTTVPSERLDVQYERTEPSPGITEMLDRIRREALMKLPEWHSARDAESSMLGQFRRLFLGTRIGQ
ncbi:MAG: hypothetical protein WCA22_21900 [Candidatus Binatus sp.]